MRQHYGSRLSCSWEQGRRTVITLASLLSGFSQTKAAPLQIDYMVVVRKAGHGRRRRPDEFAAEYGEPPPVSLSKRAAAVFEASLAGSREDHNFLTIADFESGVSEQLKR